MSRTHFWTILIGTEATSFRARDKDTLIPTLKQLQRRHPEATIKWFERDRLFDSPEEAFRAFSSATPQKRPRSWRPGGDHADPRAKFEISRDEKRKRFKQRQRRPGAATDGARKAAPPSGSRPRRPGGPKKHREE
jgi:hypothetical protein